MEDLEIKKLLTAEEVIEILNIKKSTFYSLVHRKELPAMRIGGSIRVDPTDLLAYLNKKKEHYQIQLSA